MVIRVEETASRYQKEVLLVLPILRRFQLWRDKTHFGAGLSTPSGQLAMGWGTYKLSASEDAPGSKVTT